MPFRQTVRFATRCADRGSRLPHDPQPERRPPEEGVRIYDVAGYSLIARYALACAYFAPPPIGHHPGRQNPET